MAEGRQQVRRVDAVDQAAIAGQAREQVGQGGFPDGREHREGVRRDDVGDQDDLAAGGSQSVQESEVAEADQPDRLPEPRMTVADRVKGVADKLAEQARRCNPVERRREGHRDPSGGPLDEGSEVGGWDRGERGPAGHRVEHAGDVDAAMPVERRPIRRSLTLRPEVERLGIQVDQVHFAMGVEERGQVKIVAIARAEDTEPTSAWGRAFDEERRDHPSVAGEAVPLVAALAVESGLPGPRIIHARGWMAFEGHFSTRNVSRSQRVTAPERLAVIRDLPSGVKTIAKT